MSLLELLLIPLTALLIRITFKGRWRKWALLVTSILAIFWLQPLLPIRGLDFWLPTATLGIILLSWGVLAEKDQWARRENRSAAAIIFGTILLLGLTRFISLQGIITAARPPQFYQVATAALILVGLTLLAVLTVEPKHVVIKISVSLLILLLLVLKTPVLATVTSQGLRQIMGQDPSLAQFTDIGWLGFSYVIFRLIHTMIDRVQGRLKEVQLDEFLTYTLFFPAVAAGPLERLQRFRQGLESPKSLDAHLLLNIGERLARGLFQKFILADSLALTAISAERVTQTTSTGWLWVMLIAYGWQIYFDFSGYTEIAIASGLLLGFELPENFKRPYLKPNLTQFWNNWHMSLTQWLRSYFFFPLTRKLRSDNRISAPAIIFITQMSTMILIGLWHGVTLNFILWGAWHGLGLFIHNRWHALSAPRINSPAERQPILGKTIRACGGLLTFLFVSLGWVWFSMPSVRMSLIAFTRLFGIGT